MRRLFRSLAGLLALTVSLALVGWLYQAIAFHLDEKRNPEPGRLVHISGRSLNIYCTGRSTPTVILESGLGDGIDEWDRVQPAISKFARVCSYDRAGYGGSDAGPLPRTSDIIAEECHRLLQQAGERPQYVLVGHSFGGYNVRVFDARYPNEVAGMVLVDSVQEDEYALLPPAWSVWATAFTNHYRDQARWAPLAITFGITRLRLWLEGIQIPPRILQVKYLQARASELENIRTSAEQARAAGTLGSKPLIVLTAGKNNDAVLTNGLSRRDLDTYERVWVNDVEPRLAALSRRSRRIVLMDSGHDVPHDRPDAIIQAVRDAIADAGAH